MAHILLLEDDRELAFNITTLLQSQGYSVQVYASAEDAKRHFRANKVDLLIADLFIRKDNALVPDGGISLISHVAQVEGSKVPIIAISGSFSGPVSIEAISTAITVGATKALPKPFKLEELLELVDGLVQSTSDEAF